MFERYTEKARRVIFFARYEASQFGASQIEAEHILLGVIREDKQLVNRFFRQSLEDIASIRQEIEGRMIHGDRSAHDIDLPLSSESKRVLTFAAEESELLGHRHIGTEHLLLGLLREENSIAGEVLYASGLRLSDMRQELLSDARTERIITRQLSADEAQPENRDEKWMRQIAEAGVEKGSFTRDELVSELEIVAGLRQFPADAEALLRLLAAKGLADQRHLSALAFALRDEQKLAAFIGRMKGEE
jgi:ATP-dependent Clp protease ATP-binding subunit ClpC